MYDIFIVLKYLLIFIEKLVLDAKNKPDYNNCELIQLIQIERGGILMFVINLQGKEPICDQIKTQIVRFIQLGVLNPQDKLPSVRQLAQTLGINPNTVARAYQQLESEGIVYTLNKKGVFINCSRNRELEKKEMLNQIREMLKKGIEIGIEKSEIEALIRDLIEEDEYA